MLAGFCRDLAENYEVGKLDFLDQERKFVLCLFCVYNLCSLSMASILIFTVKIVHLYHRQCFFQYFSSEVLPFDDLCDVNSLNYNLHGLCCEYHSEYHNREDRHRAEVTNAEQRRSKHHVSTTPIRSATLKVNLLFPLTSNFTFTNISWCK